MKRIFAFVICAVLLLSVFPIVAFAEGEETEAVEQEPTIAETEALEQEPPPTESEPTEAVEQEHTITEQILGYAKENAEEISVIVSIVIYSIYERKKQKAAYNSIATVNNNAVTVATNSKLAIDNSREMMEQMASVVVGYKEAIEKLLAAFKVSEEDKQKLETALAEVHTHLKTAKLANVELANEVAELLVLANIPNAKKEELYSRHRAAVGAIAEAEKPEVIPNDGQEAE